MAATDNTRWRWLPWAGTVDQLVRAARLGSSKLQELAPFPEDYDPQAGHYDREKAVAADRAKAARSVSISVIERDGYSRRLSEIAELAALSDADLDSIEAIHITLGTGLYSTATIAIRVSEYDGCKCDIDGPSRTWTAGLRHEFEGVLKPRWRLRAPLVGDGRWAIIVASLGWSIVTVAGPFILRPITGWDPLTTYAASVAVWAAMASVVLLAWLASRLPLELLRPGEMPRFQRWRRRLNGYVVAVVLGLISSLIFLAVTGA